VPAGWTKNVVDSVVWTESSEARVSFGEQNGLNVDPCQPELGLVEQVGPSVDDLAAALAALPGIESTTSDATIDGMAATRVDITAPDAFSECVANGGEALLDTVSPLEPGVHSFWILDVDGTRVVIRAVERANASTSDAGELAEVVQSVEID
jgi:hypothetical protein